LFSGLLPGVALPPLPLDLGLKAEPDSFVLLFIDFRSLPTRVRVLWLGIGFWRPDNWRTRDRRLSARR